MGLYVSGLYFIHQQVISCKQ